MRLEEGKVRADQRCQRLNVEEEEAVGERDRLCIVARQTGHSLEGL